MNRKKDRPVTIAVSIEKGGVGKTTTAVTLGVALAAIGLRVVIGDLDSQGQVATFLGHQQVTDMSDVLLGRRPLDRCLQSDANRPKLPLKLLLSDSSLAAAATTLAADPLNLHCLRQLANELNGQADILILDTAPSAGPLQTYAMFAADWIIVPIATNHAALEGVARLGQTLQRQRALGASAQLMMALPTMYDQRKIEHRLSLEKLQQVFGDRCATPISHRTILEKAPALGRTIWEMDPKAKSPVTAEYARAVALLRKAIL